LRATRCGYRKSRYFLQPTARTASKSRPTARSGELVRAGLAVAVIPGPQLLGLVAEPRQIDCSWTMFNWEPFDILVSDDPSAAGSGAPHWKVVTQGGFNFLAGRGPVQFGLKPGGFLLLSAAPSGHRQMVKHGRNEQTMESPTNYQPGLCAGFRKGGRSRFY